MRPDCKTYNTNIELLRIIACIFVVSIHLVPTYISSGSDMVKGLFFYDAMTRVAVPIFFIITGYFWDSSKSLKLQYKRFTIHTLAPTLLFLCVAGVVLPYILNAVLNMQEETVTVQKALSGLIAGDIDDFQFCFHLWYIVDLAKCYIFLPVLQVICSKEQHMQRVRRYLLAIGFYAGIIMHSLDLVGGEGIPTVFSFMPITISMWYILLGYEIKAWNEKHGKSGSYLFGGLMIYIVSVCAIFSLSYYNEYLVLGTVTGKYYYYAFLPVVTASAGAVIAISNITIKKGSHTICRIGRTTFGIYLIHPVIYSVIWHLGIEGLIPKIGLIGFLVLFILLTFIVSFAIVLLLQGFAKKCMGKGKR